MSSKYSFSQPTSTYTPKRQLKHAGSFLLLDKGNTYKVKQISIESKGKPTNSQELDKIINFSEEGVTVFSAYDEATAEGTFQFSFIKTFFSGKKVWGFEGRSTEFPQVTKFSYMSDQVPQLIASQHQYQKKYAHKVGNSVALEKIVVQEQQPTRESNKETESDLPDGVSIDSTINEESPVTTSEKQEESTERKESTEETTESKDPKVKTTAASFFIPSTKKSPPPTKTESKGSKSFIGFFSKKPAN